MNLHGLPILMAPTKWPIYLTCLHPHAHDCSSSSCPQQMTEKFYIVSSPGQTSYETNISRSTSILFYLVFKFSQGKQIDRRATSNPIRDCRPCLPRRMTTILEAGGAEVTCLQPGIINSIRSLFFNLYNFSQEEH